MMLRVSESVPIPSPPVESSDVSGGSEAPAARTVGRLMIALGVVTLVLGILLGWFVSHMGS